MNTMQFAHFIAKRDRANGSRLSYRQLLAQALHKAYRLIKRGRDLLAEVAEWKAIDRRIAGEKSVIRSVVRQALKTGHVISLYDGACWAIKASTSEKEIMMNVYATDSDRLLFRKGGKDGEVVGSVWFVYGNSAGEVICDHTDSEEMAAILAPANRRAERYQEIGL